MNEKSQVSAEKSNAKKVNPASQTQNSDFHESEKFPFKRILFLQKAIGNQAVQGLIKSGAIQTKLRISHPNDIYEQEADRVADEVMRMTEARVQQQPEEEEEEDLIQIKPLAEETPPVIQQQIEEEEEGALQAKTLDNQITPKVQRQIEEEEDEEGLIQTKAFLIQPSQLIQRQVEEGEEEEEEEPIQAKKNSGRYSDITSSLESQINSIKGGGESMPQSVRAFFEPRFGQDFSSVRIHSDLEVAKMTRTLNARAFTFGRDVVFGGGEYNPHTGTGRKLLAHELTHVMQQGLPKQSPSLLNRAIAGSPFIQLEEGRPRTLRDEILDNLRRGFAAGLLNRIREASEADRRNLERDAAFMAEIRRHLSGIGLWIILLVLRFGRVRNTPSYVRDLRLAVSLRRIGRIRDLLRTFDELRHEARVPGVRDVLDYVFRRTRYHSEIMSLLSSREEARRGRTYEYEEVHYERRRGGSGWELRMYTGFANYTVTRAGSELRVIVRIHFVRDFTTNATYYLEDDKRNEWRGGIERRWNNRFTAYNGTSRLRIIFVPMFTDHNPHHRVRVVPGSGRSNEHLWHLDDDGDAAAHEFGHMIGNPDEYRIPGSIAEITRSGDLTPAQRARLSIEEKRRTTVQGITGRRRPERESGYTLSGIMAGGSSHSPARARHAWPILNWYNNNLKPAVEADYWIE